MTGIEGFDIAPWTEADRFALLALWGLDRFGFTYQEKAGSVVLRAWDIEGARRTPVFPAPTEIAPDAERPVLVRTHLSNQLAEAPLLAPIRLPDELFAFPYGLWMVSGLSEAGGGIESSEKSWLQAGLQWRALLERVQDRLFQSEISLLTWTAPHAPAVTLFAHCVRKRFLSLGRWDENGGQREALSRFAASFQSITIDVPSLAPDVPGQTQVLRDAVEAGLSRSPASDKALGELENAPRPLPL